MTHAQHERGASFREAFAAWLSENPPPEWDRAPFPRTWPPGEAADPETARSRVWHEMLYQAGWIAPGWPVEHGGLGLGLTDRLDMASELARVRAPIPIGFQGIDILGPALIRYGSTSQQQHFLKRILSGDDIWCQGYSEPDSGSDLGSLATVAVRDGDDYVVTGQKVWTSYGDRANWCFLLARTGDRDSRTRGITFLLTPMDVPGIEWRPIRQITGEKDFGELFLDQVRIPCTHRVGEEGQGWEVATHSLAFERILASNVAPLRTRMDNILELATQHRLPAPTRLAVIQLACRLRALEGV